MPGHARFALFLRDLRAGIDEEALGAWAACKRVFFTSDDTGPLSLGDTAKPKRAAKRKAQAKIAPIRGLATTCVARRIAYR